VALLFGRFWIPLGAILYVAFAALEAHTVSLLALFVLVLSPPTLFYVWRKTDPNDRQLKSTAEAPALMATRAAFSGGLLWLAARSGPDGVAAFDAAANVGAACATLAALVAMARISGPGGLIAPAKMSRTLDAAAFSGFLWAFATALPIIRATSENSALRVDPIIVDYATTAASFSSILLIVAASLRLRWLRRFELGVADRCTGALTTATTALLFSIPAALLDIGAPDRSVPLILILTAIALCWIATTADATRIMRWLRGAIAVLALSAPVSLLISTALRDKPGSHGWAIFAVTAWSVTVGVLARKITKPLEPEQSRWLDAIERATLAALEPEPSDALRASLSELTLLHPNARSRSELWYVDPPVVKSVDVAGQLHERSGRLPESLIEHASLEPEQTLRLEVLRAIQVRRADVRPLVAWFEDQGTFSATLLQSESGPIGVLCLPSGGRKSALALEEAQSLKRLGARMGALLAISAAQARSRLRELESTNRCAALEQRIAQLQKTAEHELKGHRQGPEGLARAVRNGCYSASSKMALESIERNARIQLNQSLMLPLGVEARGWAAIAHLASPRRDGPFVVIDPVNATDIPTPWLDPVGQERQLSGGNLVLIDPSALAHSAQRAISLWLATNSSDSKAGVGCILVTRLPIRILLESNRIDEGLARCFADRETEIPQLAERAEDLRALVLEKTARLGMSILGEPCAVEPAVLAELLEYDWPGNDLELESILTRLVGVAQSALITLEHLEKLRFSPQRPDELSGTPLPTHPSFRPPARTISHRPR
jgi:hypothetical protein